MRVHDDELRPRRQSAQGRRPAAEAARLRSVARRHHVLVAEHTLRPALSVLLADDADRGRPGAVRRAVRRRVAPSRGWCRRGRAPLLRARLRSSRSRSSAAGLVASFFHLGRPERAWRAAAKWRTSWLSREVIVLPAFMAVVFLYGIAHSGARSAPSTFAVARRSPSGWPGRSRHGAFVCTAMIYACLPFLREWATPLTVANFALAGSASGFTLAAAFAARSRRISRRFLVGWRARAHAGWPAPAASRRSYATHVCGPSPRCRRRSASSIRASSSDRWASWAARSTRASSSTAARRRAAVGQVGLPRDGVRDPAAARAVRVWLGATVSLLPVAFAVQYGGLLAERWYFFAEANHPQNLYYQAIA